MRAEARFRRFVQLLLPDRVAMREGGNFVASRDGRSARLAVAEVDALASSGILRLGAGECRPTAEARPWLKRQLAQMPDEAFGLQHRVEIKTADAARLNLTESPLLRLATAAAGEAAPFLAPHHVEAGERVRRLCDRARLLPRVTMSYSAAHAVGTQRRAADIGDMAAEARQTLADLYRVLPRDCAEVLLDICGFEKGLQQVETERGWPRRSAKLVLRIALDRLAEHFGLSAAAEGAASHRTHRSMVGDRPPMFGR